MAGAETAVLMVLLALMFVICRESSSSILEWEGRGGTFVVDVVGLLFVLVEGLYYVVVVGTCMLNGVVCNAALNVPARQGVGRWVVSAEIMEEKEGVKRFPQTHVQDVIESIVLFLLFGGGLSCIFQKLSASRGVEVVSVCIAFRDDPEADTLLNDDRRPRSHCRRQLP